MNDPEYPIPLFRFEVEFFRTEVDSLVDQAAKPLCAGAFSDCTGLEATMEPKVIKAGGSNYGAHQRVGPVTFGTVVLKRGVTSARHLWSWFSNVTERGQSAYRLNVKITVLQPGSDSPAPRPLFVVRLSRALPVKFKAGDLNARTNDVGVEELHLAHEGLSLETP